MTSDQDNCCWFIMTFYVTFESQGRRSKFKVTEGCTYSVLTMWRMHSESFKDHIKRADNSALDNFPV